MDDSVGAVFVMTEESDLIADVCLCVSGEEER